MVGCGLLGGWRRLESKPKPKAFSSGLLFAQTLAKASPFLHLSPTATAVGSIRQSRSCLGYSLVSFSGRRFPSESRPTDKHELKVATLKLL